MAIETCDFRLIAELANDYLERHRRGENPIVDEYVARHPELENQIRETFPMMLLMEDHAPAATDTTGRADTELNVAKIERLGDFRILKEIGRGGMGVVYAAIQESLGRHVALKVFPTHSHLHPRHQERFRRESRSAAMLHHTNIVPVFAVGEEDGVLYYAMQFISGAGLDEVIHELSRLRRADKTKTGQLPTQKALTGVARTLMSGAANHSAESEPASSSSFSGVEGMIVADRNSDSRIGSAVHLPGQRGDSTLSESGSQYWYSVARIGVQVAEALEYAHGQGTLHRDIKPSNLLLDQNATVWVTDFGLAKSVEQDDLTHTGELVGTLRYMSPEQFSGKADQRSDLYSLGLTLYELLVLRPAFDEPDRNRLLRAITSQEPPRPRKLDARVPRDLETIVLKAIDRAPGSRYQAARDLARDLTRFLNHEPIQARPISTSERVVKWVKRRPAVAGLSAALILVFLAAFALVTWKWTEAESARKDEARQRSRKETLLGESETNLYYSHIAQADLQIRLNNLAKAETSLQLAMPSDGQRDRRGWEWGYLQRLLKTELFTLAAGSEKAIWIRSIAFSEDGKVFATGAAAPRFLDTVEGTKGVARVWDAQTGKLLFDVGDRLLSVLAVALNADGTRLATSDSDVKLGQKHSVRIWDVTTGKQLSSQVIGRYAHSLKFSPDGELLAGNVANRIVVWDAHSGRQLHVISPQVPKTGWGRSRRRGFEFSSDSRQLIAYGDGGNNPIVEVDARSGKLLRTREQTTMEPDPSGTYSARIDGRGAVQVRWAADGESHHEYRHQGGVHAFAFRPDGELLATAGDDNTVRVWDSRTGTLKFVLRGHRNQVQSVAFSPRGDRLISGDWHGMVKVWDVTRHPEHVSVFPRNQGSSVVTDFAFTPDGKRISAAYLLTKYKAYLSQWDAHCGVPVAGGPPLDLSTGVVNLKNRHTAMDRNAGRLLGVTKHDPKVMKVWKVHTGKEKVLAVLSGHAYNVHRTVISADGRWAASAANPPKGAQAPGELKVWDVDRAVDVLSIELGERSCQVLSLSSDGRRLAAASISQTQANARLEVWDVVAKNKLSDWPISSPATALEFASDGKTLAVAAGNSVSLWNADTGRCTESVKTPQPIEDLAFHPAGNRLAGATRVSTTVWDTATGHEVITLNGPPKGLADYAFSPRVAFSQDGTQLAATQTDGTIQVWSSRKWSKPERLRIFNISSAAMSRDKDKIHLRGWRLAALAGLDWQVKRIPKNAGLRALRGRLHRMLGNREQAAADYAEGRRFLTAESDGLWITGAGDHIVAPAIRFGEHDAFTIEFWIKRWQVGPGANRAPILYQGYEKENGLQIFRTYASFYTALPGGSDHTYQFAQKISWPAAQPGEWRHLAICHTGTRMLVFSNGRRVTNIAAKKFTGLNPVRRLYVGRFELDRSGWRGSGLLGALRISKVARYKPDFQPERSWKSDKETVLLFDFWREEGRPQGKHVPDLSGNDNHGEHLDRWWN